MARVQQAEAERHLYRILRGQYSRREGNPITHIDPDTNQPTRRKSKPFVHYAARTKENPDAKDEIMLTAVEAARYGMARLKKLHRRDIKLNEADAAMEQEGPPAEDFAGRSRMDNVVSLIRIGEGVHGQRAISEWKRQVLAASVLTGPMPKSRDEVLQALRAVEQELLGDDPELTNTQVNA